METREITLNSGKTVKVQSAIGIIDFGVIVRTVADYCFDDETGAYHPEYLDALTDINIVGYYTDYPLTDDVQEQYAAVVGDAVIDQIEPYINARQIGELRTAILRAVEQRNAENTSVASLQMVKTAHEMERIAGSIQEVDKSDMKKMLDYIGEGGKPDEEKIVAAINAAKKRGRKKKVE